MLSRVADSLYWMSRYLERAEHTVRMLDVNMGLMLDKSSTSAEGRWKRVLAALGNPQDVRLGKRLLPTGPLADLRPGHSRIRYFLPDRSSGKCAPGAR